MTEFYKLTFDLSFYYTLTGWFLLLIARQAPSPYAFLALAAAAGLDALARRDPARHRALRFVILLLPLASLLARPGLYPALHMLPAWAYVVWCVLTDRVSVRYGPFREQFGVMLRLLLLMIVGFVFPKNLKEAALRTAPYLVLMLTLGVCLLRMLRERRPEGVRQGLYMAAFVALCAGLTLGRAPQLIVRALGLVYRHVLAPVFFAAAIAMAWLFYGLYLGVTWLFSLFRGEMHPVEFRMESAAEIFGLEEEYRDYAADLAWLRTLLIVLGVLALLFVLFLIFRRLLGERAAAAREDPFREQREAHAGGANPRSPGRIRPRDPRRAVRYYYAKFLAECRRRDLEIPKGMTAAELAVRCAGAFPDADPAALAALYAPARYSETAQVTAQDAQRAAEAWHALKRSRTREERPGRDRAR